MHRIVKCISPVFRSLCPETRPTQKCLHTPACTATPNPTATPTPNTNVAFAKGTNTNTTRRARQPSPSHRSPLKTNDKRTTNERQTNDNQPETDDDQPRRHVCWICESQPPTPTPAATPAATPAETLAPTPAETPAETQTAHSAPLWSVSWHSRQARTVAPALRLGRHSHQGGRHEQLTYCLIVT